MSQLSLDTCLGLKPHNIFNDGEAKLENYDFFIVAFSGGKDSLACILNLLDQGVPRNKIELWHHSIDGELSSPKLMDWPVTVSYVRAVAEALRLPLYYSWRIGGYETEMLKENTRSLGVSFQMPDGEKSAGGKKGKITTRRKFPMVSMNLQTRWCTSILKIDVGNSSLCNQARLNHKRTLFITGERAEESTKRAKYLRFAAHKCDRRNGDKGRHIDVWRPVHSWKVGEVWAKIQKWSINPHPCYRLGWGRCSCAACIFSNANQMASFKIACPTAFNRISSFERNFGIPIKRNNFMDEFAAKGIAYQMKPADVIAVNQTTFNEPIFLDKWEMPAGASGELDGPC